MKIEKYAAIDIGSNAIRVLIANIITQKNGNVNFYKNALVRVPIRLGEDTFNIGKISRANIKRIIKAMKAFKLIMKVHGVLDFNAYATSALREAKNGSFITMIVKDKTGIEIEIINGKKEAELISSIDFFKRLNKNKNFLFVDVGGGSTELAILQNGKRIVAKSFKIGTVRLLNKRISKTMWNKVKDWIVKETICFDKISLLGTGGNINKIHKITQTKEDKPLSLAVLNNFYQNISSLSYSERIIRYQLNPDRADVILPASEIFLRSMEWSNASKIYVPKVGLSDGMIEELYRSRND